MKTQPRAKAVYLVCDTLQVTLNGDFKPKDSFRDARIGPWKLNDLTVANTFKPDEVSAECLSGFFQVAGDLCGYIWSSPATDISQLCLLPGPIGKLNGVGKAKETFNKIRPTVLKTFELHFGNWKELGKPK